jgi:hypothetical protein
MRFIKHGPAGKFLAVSPDKDFHAAVSLTGIFMYFTVVAMYRFMIFDDENRFVNLFTQVPEKR